VSDRYIGDRELLTVIWSYALDAWQVCILACTKCFTSPGHPCIVFCMVNGNGAAGHNSKVYYGKAGKKGCIHPGGPGCGP